MVAIFLLNQAGFCCHSLAMTPKTSPFSRALKRSAAGPACTSARPARAASITSSTRSSTTASTRPSQGYCDHIVVTLHPDGSRDRSSTTAAASPSPYGRCGLPAVEVVLTKLHAGGKFGGDGYKVSGGLHGVGISVVNALSEYLRVEVRRDGHVWTQEYERGDAAGPARRRARRPRRPAPRSPSCPTSRSSTRPTSSSTRWPSGCARWPS